MTGVSRLTWRCRPPTPSRLQSGVWSATLSGTEWVGVPDRRDLAGTATTGCDHCEPGDAGQRVEVQARRSVTVQLSPTTRTPSNSATCCTRPRLERVGRSRAVFVRLPARRHTNRSHSRKSHDLRRKQRPIQGRPPPYVLGFGSPAPVARTRNPDGTVTARLARRRASAPQTRPGVVTEWDVSRQARGDGITCDAHRHLRGNLSMETWRSGRSMLRFTATRRIIRANF